MGMVDISHKRNMLRVARARGTIVLKTETVKKIKNKDIKKGDVFESAKLAATMAVKKTSDLIPYTHPIPIESVNFDFNVNGNRITVICEVKTHYKTGVEMETLAGVSGALLTIWDMVKYLEKDEHGEYPMTQIKDIEVIKKVKG